MEVIETIETHTEGAGCGRFNSRPTIDSAYERSEYCCADTHTHARGQGRFLDVLIASNKDPPVPGPKLIACIDDIVALLRRFCAITKTHMLRDIFRQFELLRLKYIDVSHAVLLLSSSHYPPTRSVHT